MAGLDLGQEVVPRGAGDMGAGTRATPVRGMQPLAGREPHQLVVGGVVADLVDPHAPPVVRHEPGRIGVGLETEINDAGGTGDAAQSFQVSADLIRAEGIDQVAQGPVRQEGVVVGERRRLVRDAVRLRPVEVVWPEFGIAVIGRARVSHRALPGC